MSQILKQPQIQPQNLNYFSGFLYVVLNRAEATMLRLFPLLALW